MSAVPLVYAAIVGVIRDIGAEGIAKDRKNQAQGYNFRGIDDVYNALSPILAKNNLCMLPRVKSRTMHEGQTKSGGTMFYVTCEVDFDLVCATDGSTHTITAFGEAMDSADKATNKAMSAAYKYAAMQAFAIPTEGDNDADAHTPEPAQRRQEEPRREEPKPQRWSDDARKGFCADLGKMGLDYNAVAAWCESIDRPRPSAMQPAQRSALLASLVKPEVRAKLDAFTPGATAK